MFDVGNSSHKALSCTPNTRQTSMRETVSIYNRNKHDFDNIRDANRGNATKSTINYDESSNVSFDIPD
jgi:hypothetical protein